MKENYKLQNTNYKQIPNSNAQNYKPKGIHAAMQPCNIVPIPSFSHLPIFSASQLPSLPPGRRRQKYGK
jgi:hypothetical protein